MNAQVLGCVPYQLSFAQCFLSCLIVPSLTCCDDSLREQWLRSTFQSHTSHFLKPHILSGLTLSSLLAPYLLSSLTLYFTVSTPTHVSSMALKRRQATRLPPLEFFKRMRFGLPPCDDDHEDSSAYTLLNGCEPEDNFTYETKESEVGQSDEVSNVKNIEAGESEESKEGENEKEEENACLTEDSEAEENDSDAGGRYIEGLQSNSEPEDFVDMRMDPI